jgi:hypothetical protein
MKFHAGQLEEQYSINWYMPECYFKELLTSSSWRVWPSTLNRDVLENAMKNTVLKVTL